MHTYVNSTLHQLVGSPLENEVFLFLVLFSIIVLRDLRGESVDKVFVVQS